MKEKRKITRLDVSVGVLGGLVCFVLLFDLPVWALFIGWSWYFTLGSEPAAIKKAVPPMILGYVFGIISLLVYALFNYHILAMVVIVGLLVFGIMLSMKFSPFVSTVASFNGYSCMFAGYLGGAFPAIETNAALDWPNLLIAAGWLMLAHFLGLLVGWVSIRLGLGAPKKDEA